MLVQIIYFGTYLGILGLMGWLIIYYASLAYSALHGAPYVPTKLNEISAILAAAELKPGMRMIDIGCGDGRVVREAVAQFDLNGVGIDINPLLIRQARAKTPAKLPVEFRVENIHKTDLSQYDLIYIYLLPQFITQLAPVIRTQAKPGTQVISHWFIIKDWEPYLEKTITAGRFKTYYYRMPQKPGKE